MRAPLDRILNTQNLTKVNAIMKTKLLIVSQSLLLAATASLAVAGDPSWQLKSSAAGDIPVPNAGDQQTCCLAADFDGDGIEDIVVGERTETPSIVWYKFNGKGWDRHVIDDTPLRPEAGGICFDVDGDGDQDVVFGQDSSGPEIWWWENPNPNFDKPWKRRLIKKDGPKQHHDQTAGDFDGDGKTDFVSWNQRGNQLLFFKVPDNPRTDDAWSSTPIYTWKQGRKMEGFPSKPVDIDLDGKVDIVGGGQWFKHLGGTKFKSHPIDEKQSFTQCAAGQLVEGGRPEVVFSPGDMDGDAKWYEWDGQKWKAHDLKFVVHGHTCDIRDINGDGHADIFIGEMGKPGAGDNAKTHVWYGDGKGEFRRTTASQGQGIHEGLLSDLDGDGDIDIFMKPYNHHSPRIDILLNTPE